MVKRFDPELVHPNPYSSESMAGMEEDSSGDYVQYSDYEALQQENAELSGKVDNLETINETLFSKVKRINATNSELKEQLRWREYPAERPTCSASPYLVITDLHDKPQRRYWHPTENRWEVFTTKEKVLKFFVIPPVDNPSRGVLDKPCQGSERGPDQPSAAKVGSTPTDSVHPPVDREEGE